MNELQRLAHVDDPILQEVLGVLGTGVDGLKLETSRFADITNPVLTPAQFLPHLAATLGLPSITGLSVPDRRALLDTLGTAYYYKGGMHGLRLVVRALWRFATIIESWRAIYDEAVQDVVGPTQSNEWPDWLEDNDYSIADLVKTIVRIELEIDDAREYGEAQAVEYQSLLDAVRTDSGFDRLLKTYRPGFTNQVSTLLGTSQFDENGLKTTAFLLYGRNEAVLDPSAQAILEALKWNIYPDFKAAVTLDVLKHFLPVFGTIDYEFVGYRQEDVLTTVAEDELIMESV